MPQKVFTIFDPFKVVVNAFKREDSLKVLKIKVLKLR